MHELRGGLTSSLERTNKEDEHTLVEQKDGDGCAVTTYAPSIRETIVVKDHHVVGVVQMFKSSNNFDLC
jgi:hypothetical protein